MGKAADQTIYKPRILDKTLQTYLETFGAVCVEGDRKSVV